MTPPLPLPPGAVVGILGGGQLGRMMAHAAHRLGYKTHIYTTHRGSATQVSSRKTVAAYDDTGALEAFAASVDVVTYEFENVPSATAAFLQERVAVHPGPRALEVCQHRVREKTFLRDEVGVATTAWGAANGPDEVRAWVERLGRPCVLKTASGGYDGKGQIIVGAGVDPAEAWARLTRGDPSVDCIVEAFVAFVCEASVVVARDQFGTVAPFDLAENEHRHHILHRSTVPARVGPGVQERAREVATRVVQALDYVGVLGVELFITADGGVLVNELAPRPHNSGHWTMDAAVTSQFEQAVRAVVGHPLGSPQRIVDAEMTNLIGDDVLAVPELLAEPFLKLHLYGKTEIRPGRKMGHVNRLRLGPA
jgi:5-(carboxyamino)imidazole ribonucleotide synthase